MLQVTNTSDTKVANVGAVKSSPNFRRITTNKLEKSPQQDSVEIKGKKVKKKVGIIQYLL